MRERRSRSENYLRLAKALILGRMRLLVEWGRGLVDVDGLVVVHGIRRRCWNCCCCEVDAKVLLAGAELHHVKLGEWAVRQSRSDHRRLSWAGSDERTRRTDERRFEQ